MHGEVLAARILAPTLDSIKGHASAKGFEVELRQVRGCEGSDCPKVYASDQGTYLVQGRLVTDAAVLGALAVPEGESVVEVDAAIVAGLPPC